MINEHPPLSINWPCELLWTLHTGHSLPCNSQGGRTHTNTHTHSLGTTCTHMHTCVTYTHVSSPTCTSEWSCIYLIVKGSCKETFTVFMDVADSPFVKISFEPYVTDSIIKGTLHHFSALSPDLRVLVDMNCPDSMADFKVQGSVWQQCNVNYTTATGSGELMIFWVAGLCI